MFKPTLTQTNKLFHRLQMQTVSVTIKKTHFNKLSIKIQHIDIVQCIFMYVCWMNGWVFNVQRPINMHIQEENLLM